jgi:hypothetical protein
MFDRRTKKDPGSWLRGVGIWESLGKRRRGRAEAAHTAADVVDLDLAGIAWLGDGRDITWRYRNLGPLEKPGRASRGSDS